MLRKIWPLVMRVVKIIRLVTSVVKMKRSGTTAVVMRQSGIDLSFPALRMFDNPLKPDPHWLKMIITSKEEKTMVMAVNLMMVLMKLPWQWWRNQCHDKNYLHWGELKFTARWHLQHRQRYRCSDNDADASPSATEEIWQKTNVSCPLTVSQIC